MLKCPSKQYSGTYMYIMLFYMSISVTMRRLQNLATTEADVFHSDRCPLITKIIPEKDKD